MGIRFTTFPRTQVPPHFISKVVEIFDKHGKHIGTSATKKGLTSNETLKVLRNDLIELGFDVEAGKRKNDKIRRPVFFGENAQPDLQYEIDAWHPEWKAGLEIEAGRAWMGNAIYRDLVQALVMVETDHLLLAVQNAYHYSASNRSMTSRDYRHTVSVAQALYGHSRIRMPYSLCVIGY